MDTTNEIQEGAARKQNKQNKQKKYKKIYYQNVEINDDS